MRGALSSGLAEARMVWLLNALMLGIAVVLHKTAIVDLDRVAAPVHLPWWGLAALFGIAEISAL